MNTKKRFRLYCLSKRNELHGIWEEGRFSGEGVLKSAAQQRAFNAAAL
jgi:hypothetical protein